MLVSAVVFNAIFLLHTTLNYNFVLFQPLNGDLSVNSLETTCSSSTNIVVDLGTISPSDLLVSRQDTFLYKIKELMKIRPFIEETSPIQCTQSAHVDQETALQRYLIDPNSTLTVFYENDAILARSPRDANAMPISAKCALLYFKTPRVRSSAFAQTPLVLQSTTQKSQSDCAKSNLTLDFVPSSSSPSFNNLNVIFSLEKSSFTWEVSLVTVTLVDIHGSKIGSVSPDDVSTRNGMAYFCPTMEFTVYSDGDSYTVSFDHFEVQTPGNNDVFYEARDCRGFISIPILMGYTVFLILVFFTVVAVWMLSSMQTIERFDDAKKPTLYIHTQEI